MDPVRRADNVIYLVTEMGFEPTPPKQIYWSKNISILLDVLSMYSGPAFVSRPIIIIFLAILSIPDYPLSLTIN